MKPFQFETSANVRYTSLNVASKYGIARKYTREISDPVRNTPFSNKKRYCFVPDTATVDTTTPKRIGLNGSIRKRSPQWNDFKMVLFENAVFLESGRCYQKTMTSPQQHHLAWLQTTQPWVSKILVASLLITMIFSLLTLLKVHLTLLRRDEDIMKLLACQLWAERG